MKKIADKNVRIKGQKTINEDVRKIMILNFENEIVLASNNQGKIKEFDEILGVKLLPLKAFYDKDIPETGLTFIENALIKARTASFHSGKPAMSDDSGLCVEVLNGFPGVFSGRYANIDLDLDKIMNVENQLKGISDASDIDNNLKLLYELKDSENRNAKFVSVIAFVKHHLDEKPIITIGELEGKISKSMKGDSGFGYDSVFIPEGYDVTLAQMTSEEKNAISHRKKALMEMKKEFENILHHCQKSRFKMK